MTARSVVVLAAVVVAAWMAFDGGRALVTGDYVTPKSGRHAGQLGPWSGVVSGVGVDPRSTLMKSVFLGYGIAWLAVIGAFVAGSSWAWYGMFVAAVGSLWYLPFGTLLGVLQIVLLLQPGVRGTG